MSKAVILTGIRSNDEPTLGNYLGAIAPMVHMAGLQAGEFQVNMFVPDLHSFTTPIDHSGLFQRTIHNLKLFIAAGLPIGHEDVFIYRQSYIPAHSELAWILSCFTSFGEASRMVEFKNKSENLGGDQVTVALFNYPVLMAADILLYGAEWIPVGEDQRQHIELTRTLATRFNNKFGEVFVVPHDLKKQQDFINRDAAPRIRSLRNPDKKMSKSVQDPAGTILLSDSPDDAAGKIMGATTDSETVINVDWEKKPGISNLLQILALINARPIDETEREWRGKGNYGELKQAVADAVRNFLVELQAKLSQVDDAAVLGKLEHSEAAMRTVADETLLKVQKAVGLRA